MRGRSFDWVGQWWTGDNAHPCIGWGRKGRIHGGLVHLKVIQWRYPTRTGEPMSYDGPEVTLFKNKRKERPTQPDYTGTWRTADGQEFWASCWINTAKSSGETYMTIKPGKRKENQTERDQAPARGHGQYGGGQPRGEDYGSRGQFVGQPQGAGKDFGGDIPF